MKPMPFASHSARMSSEVSRPRLNWFWTLAICETERARRSCASETFETPISLIFPGPAEFLECAESTPDRDLGIVTMELVEVDPLESEPAEARVERLAEMFGTAVADPGLQAPPEPALGGDHEVSGYGCSASAISSSLGRRRRCRRCRSG